MSSNLIGYSREYIDETILNEEEFDEGTHIVNKLQDSITEKEQVTKDDLIELRSFIQEKFENAESKESKKEDRGYIITLLISALFYLLSLQNNSEKSSTDIGDSGIDVPTSEINYTPEQVTYITLDTLGLRKTSANVRLRTVPNTKSAESIITVLSISTYVHIIENNKYWVKVRCDDPQNTDEYLEGWVSKKHIQNVSVDFFRGQDSTENE